MTSLETGIDEARQAIIPWDEKRSANVYTKALDTRERMRARWTATVLALGLAASLGGLALIFSRNGGVSAGTSPQGATPHEWRSALADGALGDGGFETSVQ